MKYHVVIPVHNRIALTKKCLGCLRGQSFREFSVLVVDDGSTDGTAKTVSKEFGQLMDITVLQGTGNLFWAGGIKMGVEHALQFASDKDIIVTLNNDVTFGPNLFAVAADAIRANPGAMLGGISIDSADKDTIAVSGWQLVSWPLSRTRRVWWPGNLKDLLTGPTTMELDFLPGTLTFTPVSVIRRWGTVRADILPHYLADIEFSYRLKRNGVRVLSCRDLPVWHDLSATGDFGSSKKVPGFLDIVRSFLTMRSANALRYKWRFARLCCPPCFVVPFMAFNTLKALTRSVGLYMFGERFDQVKLLIANPPSPGRLRRSAPARCRVEPTGVYSTGGDCNKDRGIPTVSIVIPCLNEERTIRLLLDSVYAQSFSRAHMEVIIADGRSTDRTREEISAFQRPHSDLIIKLIDNPQRTIPSALNRAISACTGEFVVRLDAHCIPEQDYVERCVAALRAGLGTNVGGVWDIRPGGSGWVPRSIAAAAAHRIGAGDAGYRSASNPAQVDTVPFGAFPRALFDRIGHFDETLLANEDYEFNARIRQSGGVVWMDPRIRCIYFARPRISKLAHQYWGYGYWKFRMLRRYPWTLRWRQALPPLFVVSLIVLGLVFPFSQRFRVLLLSELLIYIGTLAFAGLTTGIRKRDPGIAAGFPFAVATMHLSWGSGFLWSMLFSGVGQPSRRGLVDSVLLRLKGQPIQKLDPK